MKTEFGFQGALFVWLALIAVNPAPCWSEKQCGKTITSKIINGTPAKRGEFPWMAILVLSSDPYVPLCGAGLITRRFAVTAKHCTDTFPRKYRLLLGATNLDKIDNNCVKAKIEEFIRHESSVDLALIKLKKYVRLSEYIQPICLPSQGEDFGGVQAVVAGFGETVKDRPEASETVITSRQLLKGVVTVASTERCNVVMERHGRPINDDTLCAGSYGGQPDHCYGDSGGPLMNYHQGNSYWRLIGIVTGAYECGNVFDYSFYANVSHFVDWIMKKSDYRY